MVQIIVGIILVVLFIWLLKKVLVWGLKLVRIIFALGLAAVEGIPVLLGFAAEKLFGLLRVRFLIGILLSAVVSLFFLGSLLGAHPNILAGSFEALKYGLPTILFVVMLVHHRRRIGDQKLSEPITLFQKQDTEFFRWYFAAFFTVVVAACTETIYFWKDWPASWIYWGIGSLIQIVVIHQEILHRKYLKKIHATIFAAEKINATEYLKDIMENKDLDAEKVEAIYYGVLMKLQKKDIFDEVELNDNTWIFNKAWHQHQIEQVDDILGQGFRHQEDDVHGLLEKNFKLSPLDCKDYAERHLDLGERHEFFDGNYFIHYINSFKINRCSACGVSVERQVGDSDSPGEWYCSDICHETERTCEAIHSKPPEQFLSEAASLGFVVMEGAAAWREGQKIFATGGQGHGFAAEKGNNRIDRLFGKDAKVVGGDNAKNGADRMVNGQQVQTKYFATGRRSVGAGFEGQSGSYKYLDESGKPMQLEVPKGQLKDALTTMAKKIKDGKVPGVKNIDDAKNYEEAKKLIRPGHLTYDQARNITKFGTIESLTYDLSEGAVVGLSAGGISFGITTFVFYLNTKDLNAALRVGVVQSGKTFGKTATIYVGAQQLHRLASVQKLLAFVDAEALSPSMRQFLEKGFGVSRNGVTNAMRGTIVTSVVVIAVTTGPDLIKLIRGRMSQAQFLKNLAVASSGVAGGVVGSMLGGAAGAALGPIGMVAGRVIGGIIGGMTFAAITDKIASNLMEEDRVKMLRIIQVQIEYLARIFVLTAGELENLSANLDKTITQSRLDDLYAGSNRRALANALIKPVVVSVVKQRPALQYNIHNVIDACAEIAV